MTPERAGALRRLERLASIPMDLAALPDQLLGELRRLVPFETFCWGAVDPASLLPTRATGTTIPCTTSLVWEVHERSARGVAAPDLRSLAPSGHQLRAALVADGTQWGLLHIERDHPAFSTQELALMDALVPQLAQSFRRWILAEPRVATGRTPAIPGVIVLDQDNEVDAISPEAERWLSDWGFADLRTPPLAIPAVVGAARARAAGHRDEIIPSVRVRLPTGVWLHVHATHLASADHKPRTAVVLERATRDEVAPLVARARRLSQRETQIALLVLHGCSTREIAARLFISDYTVQDHLKSIFEKVGVRSRRELVTEVFEPHLAA